MPQDNGPVAPYLESILDLDLFIEIVMHGFGFGSTAEFWTDFSRRSALRSKKDDPILDDTYYEKKKERAQKLAEYAEEQSQSGFAYVYQVASIQLWALVEASVDDLVILLLQDEETFEKTELLHDLKGPLIPFARATPEEQVEVIRQRLIQELAAPLKPGVARFETLLSTLGLPGSVPPEVRKALLELAEVRNLFIHRHGRADARLLQTCPWLELTLGEHIDLSPYRYRLYSLSASHYLVALGERWRSRFPHLCMAWEDTPMDMTRLQDYLLESVKCHLSDDNGPGTFTQRGPLIFGQTGPLAFTQGGPLSYCQNGPPAVAGLL